MFLIIIKFEEISVISPQDMHLPFKTIPISLRWEFKSTFKDIKKFYLNNDELDPTLYLVMISFSDPNYPPLNPHYYPLVRN